MSSSAKRALKILAAVGESGRPMGVTEIARTLNIAPGTAFRSLDALQTAHLLARDPRAPRYALGSAALGLRQSLLAQFRIRDVATPYLRQLASATGETCSLHVRIGWYAACVATAHGSTEMTADVTAVGVQALSAHAAGRAILAHITHNQIDRYRAWATARGIVIPKTLERELGVIRARGFVLGAPSATNPVAFPILKADQAFAALSLDRGEAPSNQPPAEAREIARALAALVRANPALAHQPFEHFDPDEVVLPS
jgi:IclR family acetate operon transcriptional repressor